MGNVVGTGSSAAATQLALLRQRTESLVPQDRAYLRGVFAKYSKPSVAPADYDVLDEIFLAALRAGDFQLAEQVRDVVFQRFPPKEFPRSGRMQVLLDEAKGNYGDAEDGTRALLKASEDADVASRKRMVVLAVERGRKQDAIDMLTKYVDTFASDVEAWNELCALYLDEQMYAQAQFCAEEVLLLDPHSHLPHIRLAEILFTRGDYAMAVKYYCSALELCPDTIRALYGLKQATSKLVKDLGGPTTPSKKGSEGRKEKKGADDDSDADKAKWSELNAIATERLLALYNSRGGKSVSTETAKAWLER
ncbi:hypothetical protein DFJ74DRAFT_656870 [Hyaloraphidium curvatum]|nr:hypothetical protein DFJ74DRAFT_656870 [Hyaloraphidium curvatum]